MGKAIKKDKSSYAEKKAKLWRSLLSQKLSDVRAGLVNTGIESHTRDDQDGLTLFMFAAINNKPKSLDCLLDYFERRRELRRRGWLNLVDDNGRTALIMAAAAGYVDCVEALLIKGANLAIKDADGKTARDHAQERKKTAVLELIDEWLRESDEELEENGVAVNDGLTSTQRSKLKKRQLAALERRGTKAKKDDNANDDDEASDIESDEPGPPPRWPEVANIIESVKMLRPIQELTLIRDEAEADLPFGVDPAVWYRTNVNRLELRLAPGVLTQLPPDLSRLRRLITLIVNDNSLTELPKEIGSLRHLKVLEACRNKITSLPDEIGNCSKLESLDLNFNQLTSLSALEGCHALKIVNVANNALTELDLDLENLTGLHHLFASNNKIEELPSEIGCVSGLETLVLEDNCIKEIPSELSQLKKLTVLKLDIKTMSDSKVRQYLTKGAQKDLFKYLAKSGSKGKKSKKKGKQAKPPTPPPTQGDDDDDDNGFASDDSFDITMEEL